MLGNVPARGSGRTKLPGGLCSGGWEMEGDGFRCCISSRYEPTELSLCRGVQPSVSDPKGSPKDGRGGGTPT